MCRRRRLEQGSLFALSLLPLMMAASGALAQALPAGGTFASGAGEITATSPTLVTIDQSATKAIINWTDFSIGAGNSVQFNNGTGATLNRVTGGGVSNLDGLLGATGSVYLINPNGVIIGSGGVVNVGGTFVASTLNITDANFLAGKGLTFQGASTASVVNLGQIGALGGDVALIAKTVNNEGAISAANGSAGLLAGSKVLIRDALADDGKFVVQVGGAGAGAANIGAINSAVAELRANGGNVYALAGNIGSGISATSVSNVGGRVFLTAGATGQVASGGKISADTSVEMSGDYVDIAYDNNVSDVTTSKWVIDASAFAVDANEAAAFDTATDSGADITVHTHAGSGSGDINVNRLLHVGDRDLTLSAVRDVNVNRQISGTGDKILRADNTGTGTGNVVLDATLQGGRYDLYTNALDYSDYTQLQGDNGSFADASLVVTHLLVNSYADLVRMRTDNGGDIFGTFALGRDIDAGASIDGQYVGVAFQGAFDGLGHTISNLHVTGASAGLFTDLNGGTVSNLNLTGSVVGSDYAGAVAGHGYSSSITNVTSSMSVTNTGANATGGLLGYGTYVSIDDSSATGAVSGTGDVGGLIGRTNDSIRDSFATGAVSGTYDNIGGLVGRADGYLISDSFATGSVSGSYSGSAGGLVGLANDTTLTNVYATGAVNAYNAGGGLVGFMNNGSINTAWASGDVSLAENQGGGLVGMIYGTSGAPDIEIRNAYASGSVTGSGYVGGLIGEIDGNGTVTEYTIDNVHATGNAYASGFAGGLFGVVGQQASATVSNFYATGSATGSYAGGVAGLINSGSTYRDGYASGAVSGSYQGGLFGAQNPGTVSVSNLYWDIGTTGQASAGGNLVGSYTGLATVNAFGLNNGGNNYTFSDPSKWVVLSGLRPLLTSEHSTTINNVHQLQLIALDSDATYTLGRDFSAAETNAGGGSVFGSRGFQSIGWFWGHLDGGGHQISGLTMNSSGYYIAMFENLGGGGSIEDLALVGGSITGAANFSQVAAFVSQNYGTVRNVSSSAAISGRTVSGLVSDNYGVVEGSAAKGQLTGSNGGGLVYYNRSGGVLRDSYFSGDLNGAGTLAGAVLYNEAQIQNVLVTGTLTGSGSHSAIVQVNFGDASLVQNALWNTTILGDINAVYQGQVGSNVQGYTQAQLQDQTLAASVYAGFDLDGVWAAGSGASASSDGQAHFAELYRADNVMMVDARGSGSVYGDAIAVGAISTHGDARDGDVIIAAGQASTNATQGSDAGTYALDYTAGSGMRANGGALRVVTLGGSYVIAKRGLSATLTGDVVKTYDGTNVANLTAANLTGLSGTINGDVIGLSGATGTYASVNVGTGLTVTASGVLTGANARNYELTGVTSTNGQIDARVITASFGGTVNKEYDGNTEYWVGSSDFVLGNAIDGDAIHIDYVVGAFNSSKVLQANSFSASGLTLTGEAANNYVLSNTTATGAGRIDPRTVYGYLTGTVTKQYDGTDVAYLTDDNYQLSNLIDGDVVTVSGPTTGHYASKDNNEGQSELNVTVEGKVTLSGDDASNYVVYDNGGNNGGGGDKGSSARADLAAPSINTMSGKIGRINRRDLTATINGLSTKTYDGTTVIGLGDLGVSADIVAGEDVHVGADLSTAAYADKNAGTNKAVIASGATLTGEDSGNYVLVSNMASGNVGVIDAKTISAGLTGSTAKTYDGATTATLGAGNYVLTGLIGEDVVTVAGASANYADKNAGTGKTVSASGLTLSGAAGGNYVLASTTASGAIGQIDAKAITADLTGAVVKTYDGSASATLAAGNYGLTGLVGGDTVTVASTSATYADKNAGAGKTVTVTGVSLRGGDGGNYVLTSTTASAAIGQIDARTLTAGLTGSTTKVYDGSTVATLTGANYGLTGVVGGETVTVASTGATYADKNVGTAKTVTAGGVTLGGADAGNYLLASTTASGAIGAVTPRGLTITAEDKTKNRNDADPVLTYTAGAMVTGDSLTGNLTRETGESVGAYGILQGSLSAGGNYAVTFNPAVFTIALGIPPVENLVIPYLPAEGGGAGDQNAGGQDTAPNSVGYQLAQEDTAPSEQENKDDTATCSANETCQTAPYAQGGSTSGAIHFQGYMH